MKAKLLFKESLRLHFFDLKTAKMTVGKIFIYKIFKKVLTNPQKQCIIAKVLKQICCFFLYPLDIAILTYHIPF